MIVSTTAEKDPPGESRRVPRIRRTISGPVLTRPREAIPIRGKGQPAPLGIGVGRRGLSRPPPPKKTRKMKSATQGAQSIRPLGLVVDHVGTEVSLLALRECFVWLSLCIQNWPYATG